MSQARKANDNSDTGEPERKANNEILFNSLGSESIIWTACCKMACSYGLPPTHRDCGAKAFIDLVLNVAIDMVRVHYDFEPVSSF